MALNGNFSKYATSSFGLYCEWSGKQSITGNYTDVTLKVYVSHQRLTTSARSNCTVSINGISETYTAPAISSSSSSWQKTLIKTKLIRVNHDGNGKKTGVKLSATWNFNGTYNNVSVGTVTASATVDLTAIDRAAPSVLLSTSGITVSGVTVKATAATTCNSWDYSINGGSTWTNFSTASGTSASKAITGLTPNTTYSIKVRARKSTNYVYGTSAAASVKTLGGSVISSVSTFTADDATAKITTEVTVYNKNYTHTLVLKNGSTEVVKITGLSLSTGTNTITLTASQRSSVLAKMTDKKSFTGTFTLTTYNGSTQIGTVSSKTAKVETTAANSAPVFSGFSYEDTNTISVDVTGSNQTLIQGISTLKVIATAATAKNGAAISNYSAVVGKKTATSTTTTIDMGVITQSGQVPLTVTVVDSRGYATSLRVTITVLKYEKVDIKSYSMRRINEVEAVTEALISGSITPVLINGENKNGLRYLSFRYKKTNDAQYSAYKNIISLTDYNDKSFNFSSVKRVDKWIEDNVGPNLDPNFSYYVQFIVSDQLKTTDYVTITIPQGTPLLAFRNKKVGINNRNPSEALDVNGNGKISGNLDVSGKFISPICAESGYTSIIIPAGSNLNDYHVPNIYSGSFIGKMVNIPPDLSTDSTAAFKLEVYRSGTGKLRIQRLTTTIGAVITTYERYYNSEEKWNDWYCIYRSGKAGNSVLWSGAYYMKDTHTITLSQPISLQPNGIVLVFSYYNATEGAAEDVQFKEFFVPKTIVASIPGKGHCFDMSSYKYTACCTKYLYISDNQIKGHADNVAKGTAATGITYNNTYYVLRYVLGV